MFQIGFAFFNVEIIRGFNSNFVAIYSDTSYLFGLPSKSKNPPIEILKIPVTTLRNHNKKVVIIQVDEDRALERSSGFINTCHNMNIMVKSIGGYLFFPNGKSSSSNKTLANLIIYNIINSSRKKELWCFAYHYSIWIYHQTQNRLCCDVPYFLWN